MDKRGIYGLFLLSVLTMVLIIGGIGLVSGQTPNVNADSIFYKAVDFFGLNIGETWVEIIVGFIVFLIIVAVLYDFLGLTAFESQSVKLIIAIGIALITSMVGLIRTFSKWAFAVAGGVAALGVAILVIGAVVAFVLVHFGFSGLINRMVMAKGEIKAAKAAANAKEAGAALKGFTEGTTGRKNS